jgi:ribosome-binding factor A
MGSQRITRVNELLKREIAAYLYRLIHESDFDLSAVTVTHVVTASNLRNARVFISIRDHIEDRDEMMAVIRSHRLSIQQHINQAMRLKYTPHLYFELDRSIEKGDHVLNLISELEQHYGEPSSEPTDPESEPTP